MRKIWDRGEHNAFTDLIRWRDRWWCTFRESAGHVGGDGVIRVLESADGATRTAPHRMRRDGEWRVVLVDL